MERKEMINGLCCPEIDQVMDLAVQILKNYGSKIESIKSNAGYIEKGKAIKKMVYEAQAELMEIGFYALEPLFTENEQRLLAYYKKQGVRIVVTK